MLRKIAIFLLGFFALASISSAQTSGSALGVTVSPPLPPPGEEVRISLQSFSVDLDRSKISWYRNGTLIDSGVGNDSLLVRAGAAGEITTIDVSVVPPDGLPLKKTITIRPADVDILFEAVNSYVPPFYPGKALPPPEATIKFVAMPNIKGEGGVYLKPSDFVYTWKRGFTIDENASGYGKNSYTVNNSYMNTGEAVCVTASSLGNSYAAKKDVLVLPQPPFILFYESKPLLGADYSKAFSEKLSLEKSETTIVAEPYFVEPKNLESSSLSFVWKINKDSVPTPLERNKLTIRRDADDRGESRISLLVKNIYKLFGEAEGGVIISLE